MSKYIYILSNINYLSKDFCTSEWEKELGVDISEEMWQTSLKYINEHSFNSRQTPYSV